MDRHCPSKDAAVTMSPKFTCPAPWSPREAANPPTAAACTLIPRFVHDCTRSECVQSPDRVHADVKQLPLAQGRENPYEPLFRERHVNRPAPEFPGFMVSHTDAVAPGQRQETFNLASRERIFRSVSPRRHVNGCCPQRALDSLDGGTCTLQYTAG